jgi:broad specificity phosphatase PhoE
MIDYFKTLNGRRNVYFLRHGESHGNSARIIQGRRDLPLSEKGIRQSEAAAAWFTEREIDAILCSPLKRALQTAETVAQILGNRGVRPEGEKPSISRSQSTRPLSVRPLPSLNELDTGIFTGLTVEQIQTQHPEAWRSFQRSSWEGVPQAERINELLGRAEALWRELGELFRKGAVNLLCVTHSGILQWIIKATFCQRSWMPLIPVENCSICQFSLDNNLDEVHPRYYFEWTRLNYQLAPKLNSSGHIFLDS